MQKFKTLGDAIALAEYAHRHQKDKAGNDYIDHPKRVMQTVQAQGAAPYVQIAAVLHDVTEDTAFSSDILLSLGFSEAAVQVVRLLDRGYSKRRHASLITHCFRLKDRRDEWDTGMNLAWKYSVDEFYYQEIKTNSGALIIKLADIADNMLPWRQSYLLPETQERLKLKYDKALEILNS